MIIMTEENNLEAENSAELEEEEKAKEGVDEESEIKALEVELKELQEDLKKELDTELEKVDERLESLQDGLKMAYQVELQVKELEKELATAKEEKEKYIDRLHRLQADFSNYKKRIRKEKEKLEDKVIAEVVEDLLPVIDNFELALESVQDSGEGLEITEGVEMIYNQLQKFLEKKGIKEIDSVGEEFNPDFHEAVMTEENEDYDSGEIIGEMKKGYKLEGKVIRPAMVKIAE